MMVQPPPPPPPSVSPDDEMMEICYLEKNVEENSVAPGGEQFCVSAEPSKRAARFDLFSFHSLIYTHKLKTSIDLIE